MHTWFYMDEVDRVGRAGPNENFRNLEGHLLLVRAFLKTQPRRTQLRVWVNGVLEAMVPQLTANCDTVGSSPEWRFEPLSCDGRVTFQALNYTDLVSGTPLAGHHYFGSTERFHELLQKPGRGTASNSLRLILLSKYGGTWLDQDAWPLRSLMPLLRTNLQFVGSFESVSVHEPIPHTNWHVLHMRRGSHLAERALHTLALYPLTDPSTWPRNSTSGEVIFGWNDGLTGYLTKHNSKHDPSNRLYHLPMSWFDPAETRCAPRWSDEEDGQRPGRLNITDETFRAKLHDRPPFVFHARFPKREVVHADSFTARLMRAFASGHRRLLD